MKKLSQKWIALVCSLMLFLALLPAASGAQTMYFMSVNDNFLDYSADTMPVIVGGTVYVPYRMFIKEYNGGVDFGVFYGINNRYNTLSLYSRSEPILTFDIGASNAYDATGNTYSFRAIVRNGVTFVPANAVCNYFDLQYSYLPNDYGVLIRIKKEGSYWLSDRVFLSSATLKFTEQKQIFDKEQAESVPSSPSPTPPVSSPNRNQVRVSFAFRCDTSQGPEALLNALENTGINALFLFRPEDLPQWDDEVRHLLGRGHRIGFIVSGETVDSCLSLAEEGNRLLAHIARAKTDFLLVDGPDPLTEELIAAGWACWKGNINGVRPDITRPSSLASNILLNVEAKRVYARILMDDSLVAASTLSRMLPQLDRNGYSFHTITETDLT